MFVQMSIFFCFNNNLILGKSISISHFGLLVFLILVCQYFSFWSVSIFHFGLLVFLLSQQQSVSIGLYLSVFVSICLLVFVSTITSFWGSLLVLVRLDRKSIGTGGAPGLPSSQYTLIAAPCSRYFYFKMKMNIFLGKTYVEAFMGIFLLPSHIFSLTQTI